MVSKAIDGLREDIGNLAGCGYILAATVHHYPLRADSSRINHYCVLIIDVF